MRHSDGGPFFGPDDKRSIRSIKDICLCWINKNAPQPEFRLKGNKPNVSKYLYLIYLYLITNTLREN
jgi:hypothetical protein